MNGSDPSGNLGADRGSEGASAVAVVRRGQYPNALFSGPKGRRCRNRFLARRRWHRKWPRNSSFRSVKTKPKVQKLSAPQFHDRSGL